MYTTRTMNEQHNHYTWHKPTIVAIKQYIATLTHNGNVYALTVILLSQFIFLNFHYIIGATLAAISVGSLIFQVIISSVEYYYLQKHHIDLHKLNLILSIHFWINHLIICLYIPFFIWTIVLMFQHVL